MLRKKHNLSKLDWTYPEIISIDYFLEDFENELTFDNVSRSIQNLKNYKLELKGDPILLTFGIYTLEVKGIDEAVSTIRGLKSKLNHIKNN